jgi:hypothetical protein
MDGVAPAENWKWDLTDGYKGCHIACGGDDCQQNSVFFLILRKCIGNSLPEGLIAMVNPYCSRKIMRRTPDMTKSAIEALLFQENSVPLKLIASTSGIREHAISTVPRKSKDASFGLNGIHGLCSIEGRRNNHIGAQSAPMHILM